MKLKLNRRQLVIGAVIVLVVIAALFASRAKSAGTTAGVLDDAATRACSDFAAGYSDARTKTARLALADRVMESTMKTDNDAIADRAAELGRKANDSNADWKSSADALRTACENAGWKET
ncbi:hypothetical protein [Actinoplanes sp. N902-109]|uniref:hypothetical protein n=1 Tax=Actinoplanes sp. (strain N902-109) TaxID=649831 RepID=UPI0003293533|nr:hypothetical protein [Actinoplanes sp. N902-109]AGL14326.1 hypothetical protein L083_0816 [Actinoplanes sp. N902-109]